MPYFRGCGHRDLERTDLIERIRLNGGAPIGQRQHTFGKLRHKQDWACLSVVAELHQHVGLEAAALFFATVKRFGDPVETFGHERFQVGGVPFVRQHNPLGIEYDPIALPTLGWVDPRSRFPVVVKIDQLPRGNRTDRVGGSIKTAGGKFHKRDLYHGTFGRAIKKTVMTLLDYAGPRAWCTNIQQRKTYI